MAIIIIGIITVIIIGLFVATAIFSEVSAKKEIGIYNQRPESVRKQESLDKLLAELKRKGKLTNDEAQVLLGVSDATATNYFEELEEKGLVRQVGSVGRHVYYEPSNK